MFEYFLKDNHYLSLIGILVFLLVAFIFSNNKKRINVRSVVGALALQFTLGLFVLKTEIGFRAFNALAAGFSKLYSFADAGINFMFGNLGDATGSWGYIFAVKVVPVVIFFGALMSLLSYLGIIQFFVKIISFFLMPLVGSSGAETLCATANSMLGPLESPLMVKKYVKGMTDSEMLAVMIAGMSTISASVMAVYGSIGVPMIHLLTASVMSIPGSLLISKILVPETKVPETGAGNSISSEKDGANVLDAISIGTMDGMKLAAAMAAMLIAFLSLMSMVDYFLINFTGYDLNVLFAKLFSSVAYLLGISSEQASSAGTLLGQKLVLNEFIAYLSFVKIDLAERAKIILTYALCGFSNISVIGILIGGISAMAPNKRAILSKFGMRALLGGTLVNLLNAAIAGLLI